MKQLPRMVGAGMVLVLVAMAVRAAETTIGPAKILPGRSPGAVGGIGRPSQRPASPPFPGKHLPLPPKQNRPWNAPETNLPANYINATALLFEQGLADPRGCDYREIEVGTGDVWEGVGGVVKTHGWVLPGHGETQFGICWNGLVYPLVSTGTNVDLAGDVALMITNGMTSWRSALPESANVAVQTLQGIRGCLLLRLGRVDLAANYWMAEAWRAVGNQNGIGAYSPPATKPPPNELRLPRVDPYYIWANDWAWSLFDRMIWAHQRGDERLALTDARLLSKIQPLIETAFVRRGVKLEPHYENGFQQRAQSREPRPCLTFLGQLPQVLADLERREKAGRQTGVPFADLTNVTNQTERIRILIRDLDLVQARQWGQPGGVNLAEDPMVAALIAEGDAAVDPLLDCVEQDKRLTRSVSFGRDFQRGRTVLSVTNAAWVALQSILQAGFANAAEMREYWGKYKHMKLADRWYAILADDTARNRWQEAAANLVQPENVNRFPGGYRVEILVPTNADAKLRGASLRGKRDPSVTELLARHALEVPTNHVGNYDLSFGCQMAEYLAQWDAQAALPVAQKLSQRASMVLKYSTQPLGGYLSHLALVRARAGDPAAFDDYAEWIITTSPSQLERLPLDCFEPMKEFPTNTELQAAAVKLWGQTNSPWGKLPWINNFNNFYWPTVDAGLIQFKAYRKLLCHELAKTNECGSVHVIGPGYLAYSLTDLHQSGSFAIALPSRCSATNGFATSIRWCDWIALALENSKTNMLFDPFATLVERDQAIAHLITQLQ